MDLKFKYARTGRCFGKCTYSSPRIAFASNAYIHIPALHPSHRLRWCGLVSSSRSLSVDVRRSQFSHIRNGRVIVSHRTHPCLNFACACADIQVFEHLRHSNIPKLFPRVNSPAETQAPYAAGNGGGGASSSEEESSSSKSSSSRECTSRKCWVAALRDVKCFPHFGHAFPCTSRQCCSAARCDPNVFGHTEQT